MAATAVAVEVSAILHLSEQRLHAEKPQLFLQRSPVLSQHAKLPHGDPVALDLANLRIVVTSAGQGLARF